MADWGSHPPHPRSAQREILGVSRLKMRNFMRKTARRVSDAQPSNWASLCLKNDIFSFCSNHGPEIPSATPSVKSTSHARSSCPLARASASRWACTLLARPPTAGQLSGRARGAERLPAAQRRPKKKMGLMGHRENQIRHGGRHQSVLRGKPFL